MLPMIVGDGNPLIRTKVIALSMVGIQPHGVEVAMDFFICTSVAKIFPTVFGYHKAGSKEVNLLVIMWIYPYLTVVKRPVVVCIDVLPGFSTVF